MGISIDDSWGVMDFVEGGLLVFYFSFLLS
jgi:hypothetical protein